MITAVATPAASGGIGVIRISGPKALDLLEALTGRDPASWVDRRLSVAVIRDGDGRTLDEALVVAMRGPQSFTGEDIVEIHGHGGAVNMAAFT